MKTRFQIPGMTQIMSNPSTQEAETKDCKFEASLGYVVRCCLKKYLMKYFFSESIDMKSYNHHLIEI
jgi:hypothetical protein